METWLAALESQVNTCFFDKACASIPDGKLMYKWVETLATQALHAVDMDMILNDNITKETAWRVEMALLASLICGAHIPPCRLNLLRTWWHPQFNGRAQCNDVDCTYANCLGNRLVFLEREVPEGGSAASGSGHGGDDFTWFDYETTDIKSIVVHNKTDRRPTINDLEFTIPRGPLLKLFIVHIKAGHAILTADLNTEMLNLFVRENGKDFSSSQFTQMWMMLMSKTAPAGLPYFRPSLGRTIFVEEYTSAAGAPPELWDGAAAVMGNTVRQWNATYNPSRKRRMAQGAVGAHAKCMHSIWGQHEQQEEEADM